MLDIRTAPSDPAATTPDLPADPTALRIAGGIVGRGLAPGVTSVAVEGLHGPALAAFAEGVLLGAYRFTYATTSRPAPTRVLLCGTDDDGAVRQAVQSATATCWARDLVNTPALMKTPAWLAEQAVRELTPLGVQVTVRDERWLAEKGFQGVLAVGGGSASPPRFIQASWRPRNARTGMHLALVGKGITFDTGGVNRKPGTAMTTMHTDMAGGAAVLAALRLIAVRHEPVRVSVLVPVAENALSGSAMRPGDVLRHYGGRTSEIGNTDAEGRLVLADALAYAAATLKPTVLVDVATLTGAMKTALGLRTGGLLATSDPLAEGLLAAGTATGEPLWRLPMPAEYESTLHSHIADATNAPGNPGGITAALFLRPFAGDVPWAHLDIAGPARNQKADGMFGTGGTGYATRLLHAWVASLAAAPDGASE